MSQASTVDHGTERRPRPDAAVDAATPPTPPTQVELAVADRPTVGAADVVKSLSFDVGGLATLALRDADESVRRSVSRAMDPFAGRTPDAASAADVELAAQAVGGTRAVDILGPAGDGTTTLSDGTRMYLVVNGLRCSVPDPWRDPRAVFAYEPGFAVARLFGSLVRPTLQVAIHRRGGATLHASAVEIDGSGVLVAGWSETGKTEVALGLVEAGAAFVSDKWSAVGLDGCVHAFPIGVGIRHWVVPATRSLRARLPLRARVQLAAARVGNVLVAPAAVLDRHPIAALAGDAARRSVELAGRVGLRPSEVRRAYGQAPEAALAAPLAAVILLTTVPAGRPLRVRPMRPARAAERLVRTAAYERRAFFAFTERAAYAFPGRRPWAEEWVREERARLLRLLGPLFLAEVEAPFPADPRPIAELIGRFLP